MAKKKKKNQLGWKDFKKALAKGELKQFSKDLDKQIIRDIKRYGNKVLRRESRDKRRTYGPWPPKKYYKLKEKREEKERLAKMPKNRLDKTTFSFYIDLKGEAREVLKGVNKFIQQARGEYNTLNIMFDTRIKKTKKKKHNYRVTVTIYAPNKIISDTIASNMKVFIEPRLKKRGLKLANPCVQLDSLVKKNPNIDDFDTNEVYEAVWNTSFSHEAFIRSVAKDKFLRNHILIHRFPYKKGKRFVSKFHIAGNDKEHLEALLEVGKIITTIMRLEKRKNPELVIVRNPEDWEDMPGGPPDIVPYIFKRKKDAERFYKDIIKSKIGSLMVVTPPLRLSKLMGVSVKGVSGDPWVVPAYFLGEDPYPRKVVRYKFNQIVKGLQKAYRPQKRNPKDDIPKEALERFYKIHGKDAPLKVIKVKAPEGMEGKYLVELGDAERTDYKPPKGSKKYPHSYFHEHGEESGKHPSLATTPDGDHLLILRKRGNKMRVDEWIHD